MHTDLYTTITETICAALEAGTVPWQRPWTTTGGTPRNLVSKRPYRGVNTLLLALTPHSSPWWLTFRQAKELGGYVRRGERSTLVVFWKLPDAPDPENRENPKERRPPILRHYHVFNLEQVEGIPAPAGALPLKEHERIARCEEIVTGMPQRPDIRPHPSQAFYSPAGDYVGMPDRAQFRSAEEYYATLLHELTHATGHACRLNRPMASAPAPFGSADYSQEELVAEFGAAFLCGHAGIFPRVAHNTAAYIANWLSVLKQDRRLLAVAAAQAQRAAEFILRVHPADR